MLRRSLWLLPGVMALVFVSVIVLWADSNDARERAGFQQTLAADASSVEAQLIGRKDLEKNRLREAARLLRAPIGDADATLAAMPEVVAGLDRLWNRLVWLDADHRVIARAARSRRSPAGSNDVLRIQFNHGQADHLVEPVTGPDGRPAGQLLARYDMTDLLLSSDLGWLIRRYEVDFVSELGEVIATTSTPAKPPAGARYERPLPGFKDTRLRLTPFEALASWRQNPGTLALLAGLLLLGAAASQLLRREMRQVARAVATSQTEAAWRQSMEDSALVGLRARDTHGRILYVNKTLCDMVGYTREQLVGVMPPLPFWPPESVDAMMARNTSTLAGAAPATGFESRWRHRDGHVLDVMVFEAPLVDSNGSPIGWMGSIVDISERKRLEEKDRQHMDSLAQHARLNDVGLLASELAHELNQPLTTIVGYSAGLQLALTSRLPVDPELLDIVAKLRQHAGKAGEIVHWIRKQTSRTASAHTACDVNAIVTVAMERHRRQIGRAGVLLELALAPDLPAVVADAIGLEQVITNLVRNAVDALAEQTGERRILITSGQEPAGADPNCTPGIVVSVTDNGPGLQGRTMDVLCATFYSTRRDGMGLGLGICRSILEAHGGRLMAQEARAGGAQFSLVLPFSIIQPVASPS